jgi:hypothetical protein
MTQSGSAKKTWASGGAGSLGEVGAGAAGASVARSHGRNGDGPGRRGWQDADEG